MKALIQKLVQVPGPSGYETQMREVIRAEVQSAADEIRVDSLGNLIVRKGSRQPEGKRIMLSAHMDEIGVIVTHIDENGFLRFTNLGGVRPYNHIGGRVRFLDGTIGVVGMERMSSTSKMPSWRTCTSTWAPAAGRLPGAGRRRGGLRTHFCRAAG